ncbi:MAG: LptF/LptG family permease [bacterium]|nr:LptF/LptG family permease [bacterium]
MPLRLYRYILGKFTSTFVAALAVFTVLLLMDQASRQVEQLAPTAKSLKDFVITFLVMSPPLLTYTVPLAFLMAMIWTLEQMKQDREIVAVMATGVSPVRLMPPFLGASLLTFLIAWFVTAHAGPASFQVYNERLSDLARQSFVNDLKPGMFYNGIPGTLLLVGGFDRETGQIDGLVMVRSDLAEGESGEMILARTGQVRSPAAGDSDIVVELTDGTIHPVGSAKAEYRSGSFRKLISRIAGNPAEPELRTRKLLMASSNRELRSGLAGMEPGKGGKKEAMYAIELHRRLAFPVTILLYPFVVFPAAVTLRKRGKAAAFTVSLLLFILSFFLSSVGSTLAYQGWVPGSIGAWFPDIFLILAGGAVFLPYWFTHASGWYCRQRGQI